MSNRCGGNAESPPTCGAQPLAAPRCPLCGGPNGCAPARAGRFDVPCWCTTTPIPAEVLARIPAEQRGLACVCQRCATAGIATDA